MEKQKTQRGQSGAWLETDVRNLMEALMVAMVPKYQPSTIKHTPTCQGLKPSRRIQFRLNTHVFFEATFLVVFHGKPNKTKPWGGGGGGGGGVQKKTRQVCRLIRAVALRPGTSSRSKCCSCGVARSSRCNATSLGPLTPRSDKPRSRAKLGTSASSSEGQKQMRMCLRSHPEARSTKLSQNNVTFCTGLIPEYNLQ